MEQRVEMQLGGQNVRAGNRTSGQTSECGRDSPLRRYRRTMYCNGFQEPKDLDFFPLTVNYEERLYAVGKIPGGFIKREGRPSEKAILSSRLTDRPIRPLFPEGFRNDVQIVNLVMSVDQDCSPEIAAMIGTSAALGISDVPFNGPIGGVIVGRIDGQFIINPTIAQAREQRYLCGRSRHEGCHHDGGSGSRTKCRKTSCWKRSCSGMRKSRRSWLTIEQLVAIAGKAEDGSEAACGRCRSESEVRAYAADRLVEAVRIAEKHARQEAIDAVNEETVAHFDRNICGNARES